MPASRIRPPVLNVTRYDVTTSLLIALCVFVGGAVIWLGAVWVANREPARATVVPVELVEWSGGIDDGSPDETLRVDSPEPEIPDAAPVDVPDQETQIEEMLETVAQLSDEAARVVQQQFEMQAESTGRAGSARGTGRRALGHGTGTQGLPPEQRWFIRYADRGTLDEYARQLDEFGIELGASFPNGELVYLSRLSDAAPVVRRVNSGREEERLYFVWQGGDRKQADIDLFRKAGVDARDALLYHFYPPETVGRLTALERDYRNVPVAQIRRTYFVVQRDGRSWMFAVTNQTTTTP